MIIDIAIAVLAGALALLALYTIPTVIQLKGTLAQFESLARNAEQKLDPLIEKVDSIAENTEEITKSLKNELAEVDAIIEQVHRITNGIANMSQSIQNIVPSATNRTKGLISGFTSALQILRDKIHKRRD
jgi:uncharacterized protein YoxC